MISDIREYIDENISDFDFIAGKKININKKQMALNMFNKLKTMISEESNKTYALNLDDELKKGNWYESPSNDRWINFDYEVNTKNGEIIYDNANLNLKELFETIMKDEVCSLTILALSAINVGYSISNFNEICKEYENLVEIDKDFEDIKKSFISHKKLFEKLPDGITDANDYIKNIIKYIEDDYSHLNAHINNIKEKMKKAEDIKTKSQIGMGISVLLGLISLGGSIASIGQNLFTASVNGVSTAGNAFALKKHCDSYELSKKVISELDEKLNRAYKLGNEMNNFINKLIDQLKGKENEINKFCDFKMIENYY